jgi:prophage DNA circulation protein
MERKKDSSVETFQKRLRDEVAAVENEIKACNLQVEALNKRLDGLKRACELFDAEPAAVTELLRTSTQAENGARNIQEPASAAAVKVSARKSQPRSAPRKLVAAPARAKPHQSLSAREQKAAQAHLAQVRDASHNGKVKRTDLIAAVLRTTPQTTLQELIKALNREFSWKCTESNLTGHLYTNPKLFTHTEADRSGKNPIRWSLK